MNGFHRASQRCAPRRRGAATAAAIALGLLVAGIDVPAAQAQSTGSAPATEAAPGMPGIGLTPAQKRIIYQHTAGERQQRLPDDQPVKVGAGIPDSVMLNEMPIPVKDEVGLLRDFKFAVLQDARAVVIVDPTTRTIVDVVMRSEAEK